jgi:hypothetical protein
LEEITMVSSTAFCWPELKKGTISLFEPGRKLRSRSPSKRPALHTLHLEVLEDRCLPSLFGVFTPYPVGTNPNSVAVGDFNGDGISDLAVADGNGSVNILLGNSNGSFRAAGAPIQLGHDPTSIAVRDFNRDGKLDLVTMNNDATVSVLLGNGDGTFQSAVPYTTTLPTGNAYLAVGDFAGNGIPDLAVVAGNEVIVMMGAGDGTFPSNFISGFTVAPGANLTSIAVGDFNGDGIPDLAVTDAGNNSVDVLLGSGNGSFVNFHINPLFAIGPTSLAVGDFNGDGRLDVAVGDTIVFPGLLSAGNVSVLLGNGDGTLGSPTGYLLGAFFNPEFVAVSDLNGDGKLDIAVPSAGSVSNVSVLLGNGSGTFGIPTSYQLSGVVSFAGAVGDFNRDGAQDLAVVCRPLLGNGSVDVLLNQTPVTTTVISSNANPAVAGQLVTFTANVTQAVPGSVSPTGLVTFMDGGSTVLGTGTLNSGTATFSTSSLTAGDHSITAVYQGDPNFTTSTSPGMNLLIDQDTTATALSVSANPGLAGQPITLTATVAAAVPGFGPPTGTIRFMDGTTTIGSSTLSGGVATFTTAALAAGSHSLSAVYVGNSNFTGSNAPAVTEAVNSPAPIVTSMGPSTLPEGSPAFTLTLTGSNFVPGATVQWNGTSLTVVAASATQIQASVPGTLLGQEGTALVTVTNPGGGASLVQTFSITDATLTANRVNLNVHGAQSFSGTVATFTDGNGGATASDFSAIIVWDDNSANVGTVSGTGPFTVSGTHNFATFTTLHTITVTIFDQGGKSATVSDSVTDPTANEAFVMQLYQDLLHRPAQAGGLAYWSGLLDQGASRAQVALDIEQSLEYRQDEVQALYTHYLHRDAGPAGLALFTNFLAHGGTLEQVAADIVGSAEYYRTRAGGTSTGFLSALFQDALGRNIGPSGALLFGNQLANGASRRDIASAIFGSREYLQDLVQGYFHSILGRSAGPSGLALFTNALASGTGDEAVMADIFGSDEFFAKL